MTDKRAPAADLTNTERPRGDRPPPAVATAQPDLVPREHAGHGSVGMRLRQLQGTIDSYRLLAEGQAAKNADLVKANLDLMREIVLLRDRVVAASEVPCVSAWGRHPMRCFPKDKCTFCRARQALGAREGFQKPIEEPPVT